MRQSGAAGIVMLAIVGAAVVASALIVEVGGYVAARLHAAGAADAAALAAAPATFPQANRRETPSQAAGRIAAANGVRLQECRCPIDASWATRRVEVVVVRRVDLAIFGRRTVYAVGVAEFSPAAIPNSGLGESHTQELGGTGLVERLVEVPALR